jgi:nicotinate dehydrogenase subunit A
MAVSTRFILNGKAVSTDQPPETTALLYVLRDEFLVNGPRYGCGLSECGACTVLMGDVAIRSCSIPVGGIAGQTITTLEGLGTVENPSPVQAAFIEKQAAQCAFCMNGMIMQSTAFLRSNPHPTEDEVKTGLQYNLCRCGSHVRVIEAVLAAAAKGGV